MLTTIAKNKKELKKKPTSDWDCALDSHETNRPGEIQVGDMPENVLNFTGRKLRVVFSFDEPRNMQETCYWLP